MSWALVDFDIVLAYTGIGLLQTAVDSIHQGRHLLAEPTHQGNGTFKNETSLLVYLTGVELSVQNSSSGSPVTIFLPAEDGTVNVTEEPNMNNSVSK